MFLLYITDTLLALSNSQKYWYAENKAICHQHKNILEIENVLRKKFAKACIGFVDNKLFVDHFGECKAKCILFNRE